MAPALTWVFLEIRHQETLEGLGISGHWGYTGSSRGVTPTLATMAVYGMGGLAPTVHSWGP